MVSLQIGLQRLHNQQLVQTTLQTPREVIAWEGAVQAQEYPYAKWGLAQRLQPTHSDADIEQAFTDGEILRTHVMRPTWHFLTPEDIRWMLNLTAPRVHAVNAYMYRQLELDEALLRRCDDVLARALEGGKQLTRKELGAALAQSGVAAEGQRLAYIVMHAELEAVICSGARRGKQFTYALLDERAPNAKTLERDAALAELTRRYFTSHGPATVHDFSWWSGLTVSDAKTGIEMIQSQLARQDIEGKMYYSAASMPPVIELESPSVYLLPPYDEFAIAYKNYAAIFDPIYTEKAQSIVFGGIIVIDCEVVGMWKRLIGRGGVVVETTPFRDFSAAEHEALAAAAARFGEFLEMPVTLV